MDTNMLEAIDKRISDQILSMQMEIEKLKKTLEQKNREEMDLRNALLEKDSDMKNSQEAEASKKIDKARQVMLKLAGVEGSRATERMKAYSTARNKDILEIAELIIEGERYLDVEYNIKLLHEVKHRKKTTRNRKRCRHERSEKAQGMEHA